MTAILRIHTEIEPGTATIVLDGPGTLNSWDLESLSQLRETLVRLSENEGLRVIRFTGTGLAFSAGAWIPNLYHLLHTDNVRALKRLAEVTRDLLLSVRRLPQFTVAVLNGPAVDGGFNLALACDYVLAEEAALVGYPFVSLGLQPDVGSGPLLADRLGSWETMRFLLEGKLIPAIQAREMGLVQEVVPARELVRRSLAMAAWAKALPPVVLRGVKRALQRGASTAPAWEAEVDNRVRSLLSSDFRTGMEAFMTHSRPRFTGN
ncbi:MAG: enoyl-CoA hydratase [Acidobacteriota bacterium]